MRELNPASELIQAPLNGPDHILVIGASAGGLPAVKLLLERVQPEPSTAILVAIHTSPESPGFAPVVLARQSAWPIVWPSDHSRLQAGQVYIAPPDRHLVLKPHRIRVVRGPKENLHRPAIDPLFRSAAVAYGPKVIGVLLSGMLDDGTAGLAAIRACGGTAIVQDPASAEHPDMPANALRAKAVDYCLPIEPMSVLLNDLLTRNIEVPATAVPERLRVETDFALLGRDIDDMSKVGHPAGYACPACDGPLWEVTEEGLSRYRCHTGHAFSAESLLAGQDEAVERALYVALRTLEERGRALKRLAARGSTTRSDESNKIRMSDEAAAVIRALLVRGAGGIRDESRRNDTASVESQG